MNASVLIPNKTLFRTDEFAAICGVTPRTINTWRSEGKITGKRFSAKCIRYERAEIVHFIKSKSS